MEFREMMRVLHSIKRAPRRGHGGRGRGRFGFEGLEDRTLLAGNPIVDENLLPGNPPSEWDISGAGDTTLQGFATEMSVNQGETISFKINDTARVAYHIDIYRVGYYGGLGARKVATISSAATMRQAQPAGLRDNVTGLIDCGNWAVSASWAVPASATSGVYLAKLIRDDTGGASHIPFVVRDDDGNSDLLYQTSDTTWQAYNNYGGNSLYEGSSSYGGRAVKVSYNRPWNTRAASGGLGATNWFFWGEYPMVRWLEQNGYNVSYFTDVDSDRRGAEILEHKAFLSVGHDEYWSGGQRANVEAARDAGVNLAFFSGNEVFWKTRWESSIDGSGTPYRTLVCYKETHANAKIDPMPGVWTGTWRDARFSPPADGGRPENSLTGTLFTVNQGASTYGTAIRVPEAEGKLRFWRNTSVATLQPGQTATLADTTLGYEWDEDLDNGSRPAGLIRLSSTVENVPERILDNGSTYGPGTATHSLTLYRDDSGALVFGAGTIQWAFGLDASHDGPTTVPDVRMRQATVNLFADMGVQAGSLQSGLVAATASTDAARPTSVINNPTAGTLLQVGVPITISGTANDTGGGIVAAVEISTDGGLTWHRATGRNAWTYTWTPTVSGSTTIRSRAVDDSANQEVPTAGVAVTVSAGNTLVAAFGFDAGSGPTALDSSGRGNNGTINGATWTTGRFGGALSFNGTSQWVTVNDANSLDLSTAMTLEAWVRPTNASDWRSVLLKENGAGLAYALYASQDVARPAAYARIGGSDKAVAGSAALPLNTWSHLAATYDGNTLRLYVNGTLVGSGPQSGPIAVSAGVLRIGGNAVWGEYFSGLIDEVRIYSRVLAASEIQADMNTPISPSDTTAPTVSVTSPTGGATVSGSISVTATAADDVGVAGVQFLLDGAVLGAEDTAAPYTLTWNTVGVANGSHVITARARDAAGNTRTSAGITVMVSNVGDTMAPTVSVTSPTGGSTVSGSISVTAAASDNVGVVGVQFLLNGAVLGAEDTAAPYSVTWNTTGVANGTHILTARARDAAGNMTTSTAVTVSVANAAAAGPVVAFGFNEGGGATVTDVTGHGLNGTLANTSWSTAGRFGNALVFNGTNALVTVNDNNLLDLTSGMTLEAWVNPASSSGWATAILKERPGGLAYALYASDDTGRPPAGYIARSGTEYGVVGISALALNTWTHVATSYDGAALRLYVNGTLVQTRALTGNIATSNNALRIGGNTLWGEYFNGLIDEVRVYSRGLSQAEIQSDMNTPVGGGSGGLLAIAPATPAGPLPHSPLTSGTMAPLVIEAAARWQNSLAASADASTLAGTPIEVVDLPGTQLGWTANGKIWIDRDAAGYGWFLDATPEDDREFRRAGDQGEQGRIDLLTVLAHEMGHILGFADGEDGVMAETLVVGVRRLPGVGLFHDTALDLLSCENQEHDAVGIAVDDSTLTQIASELIQARAKRARLLPYQSRLEGGDSEAATSTFRVY